MAKSIYFICKIGKNINELNENDLIKIIKKEAIQT